MGKILKQNVRQALDNDNLRTALGNFGEDYPRARQAAYANIDFEALRSIISATKGGAAEDMERLASEFTRVAEARGATVYRASTAQEAKKYILDLAQKKGVKTVVKSKSMATEEIHLNSYLEENGLDVAETDLGEWILQLSGDRPSHMVMPAIHMTRRQVADIFSAETEQRVEPDIPAMVKIARERLRKKFLSAEMGITGANIAVAETGTLVLVTNEGNARLTSTLPPLHVAVVGLEKLVPKFSDIEPILKALPKSATGQAITSYVTMITGPAPVITAEGDLTQKELHIVLLDSGRTQLRDDPVFKQALQCIRCASCLNVCPVFQLVGGHVYGYVYTGGIGTILTAFLNGFEKSQEIQSLCLGCGRCKTVCPGQIDIPRLILELRKRVIKDKGMSFANKLIFENILPNRPLFHKLLRTAAAVQKPFTGGKPMVRHLPLHLAGLTEGRSLPALADVPLRDRLAKQTDDHKQKHKQKKKVPQVGLFGGCLAEFAYPEIGVAVRDVITHLGMELVYPLEQGCCGYPAYSSGAASGAQQAARHNIEAFEKSGVDYIITPCPTCTWALMRGYPLWLKNDSEWKGRAEKMAARVSDFSAFVYQHSNEGKSLQLREGQGPVVTYHDSCHLKNKLGISKEPRALLTAAGVQLKEMPGSDRCCGFGGSYSIKYPELSGPILNRKLDSALSVQPDVVAVDCPGCLLQISGGLDQRNAPVKVEHTAQILARSLAINKGQK